MSAAPAHNISESFSATSSGISIRSRASDAIGGATLAGATTFTRPPRRAPISSSLGAPSGNVRTSQRSPRSGALRDRLLRHGDKQVGADGLLGFADSDGEIEDLDVVLADVQALRLAADENRQRCEPPVPGLDGVGGGPPVGIGLFYRSSSAFGLLVPLRLHLHCRFQRCFGLVQLDLGSISRDDRGLYRPVAGHALQDAIGQLEPFLRRCKCDFRLAVLQGRCARVPRLKTGRLARRLDCGLGFLDPLGGPGLHDFGEIQRVERAGRRIPLVVGFDRKIPLYRRTSTPACLRQSVLNHLGGSGGSGVAEAGCHEFWSEKPWVCDFDGNNVLLGDDDALIASGDSEQPPGKLVRHPNAAVGGRVTGQDSLVHCDASISDPLHERHGSAAINIGVVIELLAEDGKDPLRRRMARLSGGHGRLGVEPLRRIH